MGRLFRAWISDLISSESFLSACHCCPRSTIPEGQLQLVWLGSHSQPLARGGQPNHEQWQRGSPGEKWWAVIKERENRNRPSKNSSAHYTRLGQRHHKMLSWVPWYHAMEGVGMCLTLFPHLFLSSATREKTHWGLRKCPGLTLPWSLTSSHRASEWGCLPVSVVPAKGVQ